MTSFPFGQLVYGLTVGAVLSVGEEGLAIVEAWLEKTTTETLTIAAFATCAALACVAATLGARVLACQLRQCDVLEGHGGGCRHDDILEVLVLARGHLPIRELCLTTALDAACTHAGVINAIQEASSACLVAGIRAHSIACLCALGGGPSCALPAAFSLFSHTHTPQKPGQQKQRVVPSMLSDAEPPRLPREQKRIILVSVSITAPLPAMVSPPPSLGWPGTLTKPTVGSTDSISSCRHIRNAHQTSWFHTILTSS